MKVAVLGGTGDQGLGIAIRLVQAGEDVYIGSREASKAERAADEIRLLLDDDSLTNVSGYSNPDAANKADVVIMTVPILAQKPTLESVKDFVKGKVFVDATVPLESNIGGKAVHYFSLWEGSAAERTESLLGDTGVKVVSAFNNICSFALNDFKEEVDCDCLVSGDDADAKKTVFELAHKIPGVQCVDCGPLEQARTVERITALLINLNIRHKSRKGGIRISGIKKDY